MTTERPKQTIESPDWNPKFRPWGSYICPDSDYRAIRYSSDPIEDIAQWYGTTVEQIISIREDKHDD